MLQTAFASTLCASASSRPDPKPPEHALYPHASASPQVRQPFSFDLRERGPLPSCAVSRRPIEAAMGKSVMGQDLGPKATTQRRRRFAQNAGSSDSPARSLRSLPVYAVPCPGWTRVHPSKANSGEERTQPHLLTGWEFVTQKGLTGVLISRRSGLLTV